MGTRGLLVLGIGSVLVLGNPAFAQQPAPKPDYGAPITQYLFVRAGWLAGDVLEYQHAHHRPPTVRDS